MRLSSVVVCLCFLAFFPDVTAVRAQNKEPPELTEARRTYETELQNITKITNEQYLRTLEELKNKYIMNGDIKSSLAVGKEIEKFRPVSLNQRDVVISVAGSSRKLGSKVFLSIGDTVDITATGIVNPWPGSSEDKSCGPEGQAGRCYGCLLEDAPMGGLIARIANGPWVFVGKHTVLVAETSGELIFAINDVIYYDNKGAFTVLIRRMDK